jgi:hypothetical protein
VVAARQPPRDPFKDIKEMEEKYKQEAAATKAKLKREAADACTAKASAADAGEAAARIASDRKSSRLRQEAADRVIRSKKIAAAVKIAEDKQKQQAAEKEKTKAAQRERVAARAAAKRAVASALSMVLNEQNIRAHVRAALLTIHDCTQPAALRQSHVSGCMQPAPCTTIGSHPADLHVLHSLPYRPNSKPVHATFAPCLSALAPMPLPATASGLVTAHLPTSGAAPGAERGDLGRGGFGGCGAADKRGWRGEGN